jgi:hypothetical protein
MNFEPSPNYSAVYFVYYTMRAFVASITNPLRSPHLWAEETVLRLATGSAGVPPARMKNNSGHDFEDFAGETPALPVNCGRILLLAFWS